MADSRALVRNSAFLGLTGVALGAFGAHALRDRLAALGTAATWETATRYHLVHAVALLALAALVERIPAGTAIGRLWTLGTLLFSGSLYALALGGPRWLGPVTPLGGICLLAGWALLAYYALRKPSAA
ncbi:DUF423 domain-containing protein [Nibricoccus sp. IMCC34717]|uniref:DUF423 domain-containing protein n=1 Tax=Nibricoccus sp. IMCC34717 TaxID=3034021 RepID=UPI00384B02BF